MTKMPRKFSGERIIFSINNAGTIGEPYTKKEKKEGRKEGRKGRKEKNNCFNLYLTPYIKINLR